MTFVVVETQARFKIPAHRITNPWNNIPHQVTLNLHWANHYISSPKKVKVNQGSNHH